MHIIKEWVTKNKLLCSLLTRLFHEVIRENGDERAVLTRFHPKPAGTPILEHARILREEVDLQIIIPCYNVEEYVEACMESVLSQKCDYSMRIVLVDDGSTDNTGSILDTYASDPNITVIHQKNGGASSARNHALAQTVGRYVMFVDADDCLLPGAVQALMDKAFADQADIVQGGVYGLRNGQLHVQKCYEDASGVFPLGLFEGAPWGKVYAAKVFEKLCFPEGYLYEDSINRFLIYPNRAYRCSCVKELVYAYRDNTSGVSHLSRGREDSVETYWLTEELLACHAALGLPFDAVFKGKLLDQILLNDKRTRALPGSIRKSIFLLSRNLLEQYFSPELKPAQHESYERILRGRDYGAYVLYGLLH